MRHDPHSYADFEQARTTHIQLELRIDPTNRALFGVATLHLDRPCVGQLHLDSRGLKIHSVTDSAGADVPFTLDQTDAILGEKLVLTLAGTEQVTLTYDASENASALMWLSPEQTDGGVHPFVLTQCQAIHARSIVPLQDTPAARITYTAVLDIPAALNAVMSAAPGDDTVHGDRRRVTFTMPQAIPPYLFAFAVGDLQAHDLAPRCRVFAEPGVLKAAAWEFADVGAMLTTAEALFGPYRWDRYDFVVLPPSFPMGGMENPRMTFLTPTLIAGDRSLVGVLAHELAHSWTGNLVTNATNEDFWLNEGWTVWAERRILEELYGAEEATQQAMLGRAALERTLAERQERGQKTSLTYDQQGLDPDEAFSRIPYEAGFLLVSALEKAVGRPRFDVFVQKYIDHFAFRSITTNDFITFVDAELNGHGLDLRTWVQAAQPPAQAPTFASARLESLKRLDLNALPNDLTLTEKLFVLDHTQADPMALGERLKVPSTGNAELKTAWLTYAIGAGTSGLEPELTAHLNTMGRTKLLTPIVRAMLARDDLASLARDRVAANRTRWHVSTLQALDPLLVSSRRATPAR